MKETLDILLALNIAKEEIEKLKVENEGLKKDLMKSTECLSTAVAAALRRRTGLYEEMDELKEEIQKLKSQALTLTRGSKRSAPEVFDGFMLLAKAQQKRNLELNEEIKKLKKDPKHKVYDDFMVLAKAQAKKIFELIEKNKALNKDIKKLKEDIPVGTRLNESIS